ncbi:MAG: hypothetical protein NC920_00980 [Candidatus Omnitrophica bacterium]|nr:hypothetical protein [Candidatus Omnitrophota bacterium]
MKRIIFNLGVVILGLSLIREGYAFWLSGPESIYIGERPSPPRSPGAPKTTDPTFILVADSFVDDKNEPTRVTGAEFSHGEGVVTKMVQKFQEILQGNPKIPPTILQLATFEGKTLALYDANGPITDPNQIPQGARRIIVLLADIPGEEQVKGRWVFSGDAVYKTLVNALEQLKQMGAAVVVNLSMSAEDPAPVLEELIKTYKGVLFVASAEGYPGKYAKDLSNVLGVGNTGSSADLKNNTIYAEGYVEIPGRGSARGSSFSTSQATILGALVWQMNPNINSSDLRNILVTPAFQTNADPPGELNPQGSLEMVENYTPIPVWGSSPIFPEQSYFGFLW